MAYVLVRIPFLISLGRLFPKNVSESFATGFCCARIVAAKWRQRFGPFAPIDRLRGRSGRQ